MNQEHQYWHPFELTAKAIAQRAVELLVPQCGEPDIEGALQCLRLHKPVASTQELNSSNDPDYRDDCLLGYPPVEPEPDVPEFQARHQQAQERGDFSPWRKA